MKKTDNTVKKKRIYYHPEINVIMIDNKISLVMMSAYGPGSPPNGNRESEPDDQDDTPYH